MIPVMFFFGQLEDPDWKHAVSIFMGLLGDPLDGVAFRWVGGGKSMIWRSENLWKYWEINETMVNNLEGIMLNLQGIFISKVLGLSLDENIASQMTSLFEGQRG